MFLSINKSDNNQKEAASPQEIKTQRTGKKTVPCEENLEEIFIENLDKIWVVTLKTKNIFVEEFLYTCFCAGGSFLGIKQQQQQKSPKCMRNTTSHFLNSSVKICHTNRKYSSTPTNLEESSTELLELIQVQF